MYAARGAARPQTLQQWRCVAASRSQHVPHSRFMVGRRYQTPVACAAKAAAPAHPWQQHKRSISSPPPAAAAGAVAPAPSPSLVKTYMELSKFRLSSLVVFTTSAGYLAAGGPFEAIPFASACLGTMLASCSAGTFNQIIESDRDARMMRTQMRPIPSGRVSRSQGIAFGAITGAASAGVLLAGTNPLTAALGIGNLFLYAVPYTLSKTRTEANTWIGSVVGAVPPLMGWAAATGNLNALDPVLLGSALFLWQFPHFFALSWMYRQDYARGGFKMVPCADPTGSRTAELIMRYSMYLAPLPVLAAATDVTSWMFAVEGSAINAVLLYRAHAFYRERSNANAKDVFRVSLWYLPAVLALFVYHSKRWHQHQEQMETLPAEEESWLFSKLRLIQAHLKAACVHEMLAKDDHSVLCPVVVAEDAAEKAKETVITTTVAGAAVTER
eukprot:TRINITY_DN2896_c0_g1_i1.p1 TRINITY_DN2896_c0_g1~~TRINITY_DN2896_c0_g1_i1.p1  ORF type:complete len:442 (-),score=89.16 TRINITY_DN2896_c0_g1_i1:639-1964(-)